MPVIAASTGAIEAIVVAIDEAREAPGWVRIGGAGRRPCRRSPLGATRTRKRLVGTYGDDNELMWFRLEHHVVGVGIATTGLPETFTVAGIQGHRVSVTFRPAMSDDDPPRELPSTPVCEAAIEFEPSPKIQQAFEALSQRCLPDGSRPDADLRGVSPNFLNEDGSIDPDQLVPFWVLPEGLQSAIQLIRKELYAAARRAVAILRWRIADEGPHQPLVRPREQWSLDGDTWYPLPLPISATGSARTLPVFAAVRDDVQMLLDQGADEPLAHTLWREAWALRGPNPRSSLLIGMAALEVGVKHYLSAVVPDARWLLEEIPAPPIDRLLRDYIPGLPTPSGVKPSTPSKDVTDLIRKAQGLRNKVAHAGREKIPPDTLESTLQVVRGVLLNLDRYRGFDFPRDTWS